jgi:regulator of protease activity HflC (stomatin/prohibitin superfamily)
VNGLAWLNDLMTWLGRWVPRIILIRATHAGVLFGRGGSVMELHPGVHVYWPIVQELELVSTRIRTTATCPMLIGGEVIGVLITYNVVNPVKMVMTFSDLRANLDQRAQAAISLVHTAGIATATLAAQAEQILRAEFDRAGVHVDDVRIGARGWVIPIKNVSDWSEHESPKL